MHASPDPAAAGSVRTLQILVLDDDPVDAGLLADALSTIAEYDVRCRIATELPTARAAVAETDFDLVFADYWLGTETSIGFVTELAATRPDTAVVISSDADALDVQTVGLRAGAVAFLPKADVSRTNVRALVHAVAAGFRTRPAAPRGAARRSPDLVVAERLVRRAERVALSALMLRYRSAGDEDGIATIRSLSDRIRADAREIARLLKHG